MALGKAMNKKSFYGGMEAGAVPDIAMPPLDQTPPIQQAAPDPWAQQQQPQAANNPFQVPDELPEETRQAMQQSDGDEMSPSEEQTVDNMETVEELTRDKISRVEEPARSPHFKALRDQKERAEIERDIALRRMYEMEQLFQAKQQQQPQVEEEPDYEIDIDSDALVEGKSLKKVASRIQKLEKQLKETQQRNQVSLAEAKIRSSFPDIDRVVSQENISLLNQYYPEIAQSLKHTPDLYDQAAAAYSAIKNLGIYKDQRAQPQPKAVVNTQKPRSLASVSPQQGDSPLSRANAFDNGLTDEVKEQLRKEMYNARRSI